MKEITLTEYYNKVLGSWIGRVVGDFVGEPIEFIQYETILEQYGDIENYLKPIDLNYVNDDEMYEICALLALEKHGINLTAKDIAQEWIDRLFTLNFTAEMIALKNLRQGIKPPESGINNNYYFDAIGAQMRADIWGQIAPGCPHIVKKYAEMDGKISHAGIGIEGEVFVAILLSNSFFETDIRKNIESSLKFIPSTEESLYSQMVKTAISLYDQFPDNFRKAREELIKYWDYVRKHELKINEVHGSLSESLLSRKRKRFLFGSQAGVHVLPNIGIIILSLLYGSQDDDPLGKSVCIAAMCGLDTDCNCGNVGAIFGAQLGADIIPPKWKDPLQNTFATYVKGYEKWKITELAQRISVVGKEVIKEKCQDYVKILE